MDDLRFSKHHAHLREQERLIRVLESGKGFLVDVCLDDFWFMTLITDHDPEPGEIIYFEPDGQLFAFVCTRYNDYSKTSDPGGTLARGMAWFDFYGTD